MSRIAIVTDSTAYLTQEEIERHQLTVVPLSVLFGEEAYREGVDLSAEQFYQKMKETEVLPTTTQPSVGDFMEAFQRLADKHEEVISIHISSGLSGTYQAAYQAAQMVEQPKVHIFDSEISSAPQALLVREAARLASQGEGAEAILGYLSELVERNRAYFIVDDLAHLHRGGRLNATQLLVGNMLRIKPVLTVVDKKIVPFEKIRTRKKAKERIMQLLAEDVQPGQAFPATVVHARAEREAIAWMEEVKAAYPQVEISLSEMGPVLGTHVGEGMLGLTWNTHPRLGGA